MKTSTTINTMMTARIAAIATTVGRGDIDMVGGATGGILQRD